MHWLIWLMVLHILSTIHLFISGFILNKKFNSDKSLNEVIFITFCPVINLLASLLLIFNDFKNCLELISIYFEQKRNEKRKVKSFESEYIICKYGKYFYIKNIITHKILNNKFINKKMLLNELIKCNGFTEIVEDVHIVFFNNLQDARQFLEILESLLVLEKIELYGE